MMDALVGARRKATPARRLTREKIAKRAIEIIGRGRDEYGNEATPADIEAELVWMKEACSNIANVRSRYSGKHMRAIRQFTAVLRKARRDLPEDLRLVSGLDLLLHNFEAYAAVKLQPRPEAFEKSVAADAALHLCQRFNVPTTTYERGAFCRLAAVLYGDESADLKKHCRAALKQPR
jgi:hypothetical protein